jgi:hypothetical protein
VVSELHLQIIPKDNKCCDFLVVFQFLFIFACRNVDITDQHETNHLIYYITRGFIADSLFAKGKDVSDSRVAMFCRKLAI